MFYSMQREFPIGKLTMACDDSHLVGVWIEGQKYFGGSLTDELHPVERHPILEQAAAWLEKYFGGGMPSPKELPLAPIGSAFRQSVWNILCEIPYGEVTTYGAIARRIAAEMGRETMSAQAVGGAIAHNPIMIIIPCHRVVGTDGSLTGYAGGMEVKQRLLVLEGVKGYANLDNSGVSAQ